MLRSYIKKCKINVKNVIKNVKKIQPTVDNGSNNLSSFSISKRVRFTCYDSLKVHGYFPKRCQG